MNLKKIIALVPMKEHSERVPNKNIRSLAGRPAFHWIIESLQASSHIDEIIINTDSEVIAESASKYFNVKIHHRPKHLVGDMITMQPIIAHDLKNSEGDIYLQTHSTNPLLTTKTIDEAIAYYYANESQHDALFTVTPIQSRFFWEDGTAINHEPSKLMRTQDLPPIYEENSCLYIFSKETNLRTENRLGSQPIMFPINVLEAVDIDTIEDFYFADYLLSRRK
jgi:CMP-N-acetylneuraminic acid synthetase